MSNTYKRYLKLETSWCFSPIKHHFEGLFNLKVISVYQKNYLRYRNLLLQQIATTKTTKNTNHFILPDLQKENSKKIVCYCLSDIALQLVWINNGMRDKCKSGCGMTEILMVVCGTSKCFGAIGSCSCLQVEYGMKNRKWQNKDYMRDRTLWAGPDWIENSGGIRESSFNMTRGGWRYWN